MLLGWPATRATSCLVPGLPAVAGTARALQVGVVVGATTRGGDDVVYLGGGGGASVGTGYPANRITAEDAALRARPVLWEWGGAPSGHRVGLECWSVEVQTAMT